MLTRRRFIRSTGALAGAAVLPNWLLAGCSKGIAAPGFSLPMGMNLAGIADWEPGFPFRNLMWGARKWGTRTVTPGGPWDTEKANEMPIDPQGYPLEAPFRAKDGSEHVPYTLLPSVRPKGRYVVRWKGTGKIDAGLAAKLIEQSAGRAIIEITAEKPGDAVVLAIVESKKGDHVRDVTVVAEADERVDLKKDPWLPEALAFLKPFHALRFMDWQGTNNSIQDRIEFRKKLDTYTMVATGGDYDGRYGPKPSRLDRVLSGGVAWELIVDLCNRLKTDCWLCVPHRADDEYIRRMASFFKANLAPDRKLYVEFSNEIWNFQFEQTQWMLRDRAVGDGAKAWGYDVWDKNDPTKGSGHPERIAWLFRRNFAIWESVFTGADRKRIVRVVASQHGWFDVGQRTVEAVMKHGGADAVSPAGYFGPNDEVYAGWEKAGAGLTAAKVMDDMMKVIDTESAKWTQAYGELAKKHGLRLVVYEGGQHIQSKGQAETPYNPALKAAQFDPRMEEAYLRNFEHQRKAGVDLFMAFASVGVQGSRYGSWGHAETYATPLAKAPKLRAVLAANSPKK